MKKNTRSDQIKDQINFVYWLAISEIDLIFDLPQPVRKSFWYLIPRSRCFWSPSVVVSELPSLNTDMSQKNRF